MNPRSPLDSVVATTKGDDGTTGLLYGGPRIAKDDPRTEAYGTIDETVAALGLARAYLGATSARGAGFLDPSALGELILRFQRELFVAAAELATNPDAWERLQDGRTRVSESMVEAVGSVLIEVEHAIVMPTEFVVPGETPASAALELARTTLRRAERRAVTLQREGLVPGRHLIPYLNRLADLLWVLARAAEQAASRAATPARQDSRPVVRPDSAGTPGSTGGRP